MQRNVTRTAQVIDLCLDCRSVLKLAVIEAHPDHDKLRITGCHGARGGCCHGTLSVLLNALFL